MSSNIGSKIQQALKQKNIKQKDLAHQIGIPNSSMSAYLNDKREIPSSVLFTISRELQLDLNGLANIHHKLVINDQTEVAIISSVRMLPQRDRLSALQYIQFLVSNTKKINHLD